MTDKPMKGWTITRKEWCMRYAEAVTGQTYPSELTRCGEQLVIPGCERQPVSGKPAQLSLFGG
jgi:hypothetical protein